MQGICERIPALTVVRYVYDFDEPSAGGRELLGGKGVGLAEMTQLGVPVPAGFTITTDACRAYMAADKQLPEGLEKEIDEHLARLEERAGKRFGGSADPLLVSVRSGAAVSMPGMMDTVLNVGVNAATAEALAQRSGGRRFALDSFAKFCRMYAATVIGVPREELGPRPSRSASNEELREDIEAVQRLSRSRGMPIPDEPREQLRRAVEAVFRSWHSPRARFYRTREG